MPDNYFSRADLDSMDKRYRIKLINSLSGFKSVNLVGTMSESGQTNLSVISSFFHVGANPPLMGFILRPHSNKSPRHTLMKIQDTGFYTVNHITESFYKQAHQTSARYPENQSEFGACGLTEKYIDGIRAPFVAESPIQIGMKLVEVMDIQHNDTHFILGEIQSLAIQGDFIQEDGYLDIEAAGSLCVSSLDGYHKTQRLSRLSYAKPELEVKEIPLSGPES